MGRGGGAPIESKSSFYLVIVAYNAAYNKKQHANCGDKYENNLAHYGKNYIFNLKFRIDQHTS